MFNGGACGGREMAIKLGLLKLGPEIIWSRLPLESNSETVLPL